MGHGHNIFVSHRHDDDEMLPRLKSMLLRRGVRIRDSSITAATPNRAHDPDYIKSILAKRIRWAGKIIVVVSPDSKNHPWMDWEIEYVTKFPRKRIIAVWAFGAKGCELPRALKHRSESVIAWNAEAIIAALDTRDR